MTDSWLLLRNTCIQVARKSQWERQGSTGRTRVNDTKPSTHTPNYILHTCSVKNWRIVSLGQTNSSPNPEDNALSCREFQYFLIFSKTKEKKIFMYIFRICLASLPHSEYKQKASKLLICISDKKITQIWMRKFCKDRKGK